MKNSHSGGKISHSAEKIHIQKTQILDPECGITHAECEKKTLGPPLMQAFDCEHAGVGGDVI